MMRILLSGFIAGALSVLIFHQGSAFLLHHIGNDIPAVVSVFGKAAAPFNMAPTKPLGVPAIASQCFWGGVWGVVLALFFVSSSLLSHYKEREKRAVAEKIDSLSRSGSVALTTN